MIELVPLFIVAAVACVAIVAMLTLQDRHANQLSHLLAHAASRESAAASERWSLATRIQSPELVRTAPPAPPVTPSPEEVLRTLGMLQPSVPEPFGDDEPVDPDDVDETYLVGTGPAFVSTVGSEVA